MNKILYNLILVFFSVFGIGFIPKFSRIFTSVLALVLVLLIPDENLTQVVVFVLVIAITAYLTLIGNMVKRNTNFENIVSDRVIGVFITLISPFMIYSWEWLILDFFVYNLIFAFIKLEQYYLLRKHHLVQFSREIICGILTLISINVIYSGFNAFSILKMFLN